MNNVEGFNLPVADRKRIIYCLAEDVLYIHGVDAFFGKTGCNCEIDYWKFHLSQQNTRPCSEELRSWVVVISDRCIWCKISVPQTFQYWLFKHQHTAMWKDKTHVNIVLLAI